MKTVWLGLGGNIGDVQSAMAVALNRLNEHEAIDVNKVSSLYKTPPWGVEDQPWFHNCCAEISTSLSPEDLLEVCQATEHAGKRERIIRWGPRTIDIDILVFEGVEQTEQRLTLPHPRITERAFVLQPFAEIAAGLPLGSKRVHEWAASMKDDTIEKLPDADWWKAQ